jgi:hypothetical protein
MTGPRDPGRDEAARRTAEAKRARSQAVRDRLFRYKAVNDRQRERDEKRQREDAAKRAEAARKAQVPDTGGRPRKA